MKAFRSDRPFLYETQNELDIDKKCQKYIFKVFFGIIRGKRGMGERRHEIDAYLLDNRNRTQKWDE